MSLKLTRLTNFRPRRGPLLLIIMDGVGIAPAEDYNAFYKANTPVLDKLMKTKLYTELKAHGTAVGLPSDKDMGNSEVGHNAIGSGRVFAQGAKLVNEAIKTGKIFETDLWNNIMKIGISGNTVHFIGLLSDGNVHSHVDQLFALINRCAKEEVKKVNLHVLLDGRDVYEKSALTYVKLVEELFSKINQKEDFDYKIASGGGRMNVTMDRYNADWNVVKKGWDAHVLGKARHFKSTEEAIQTYYEENPSITDQYLDSFVIVNEDDKPIGTINDGDAVIFFNFRGDRAVEISRAFEEENFKEFNREKYPKVLYSGMMQYDGDLQIPSKYLVIPPQIEKTSGEYLCNEGITSFAISETQKFGHVTYFWNGNNSGYINEKLEKYIEIPSDKIEFDKAPKMKAYEITEKTIGLLNSGKYRFGRINFPNGDMVGHTGNLNATIIAMETVDECISKLLEVIKKLDGIAIITADHGNCDVMYKIQNDKKVSVTSHTLNPVPFIICDFNYNNEYKMRNLNAPSISNVTATFINLLGYEKPKDYDESLITFN